MKPNDYRKIQEWLEDIIDEWELDVIATISARLFIYSKLTPQEKERLTLTLRQFDTITALERKFDTLETITTKIAEVVVDFTTRTDRALNNELARKMGFDDLDEDLEYLQLAELLKRQSADYLNGLTKGFITRDNRFKSVKDAYLYECAMLDAQGLEALPRCIEDISSRGVVTYNPTDNRVTDIGAEYKRQVTHTVEQITNANAEQMQEFFGTDYVEVTAHYGARPTHAVWQGKVYKVHGSEPGYPNLYEATQLGEGVGLKGWNCRHDYFPFVMGVSERQYTDQELVNMLPENNKFTFNGKEYDGYTSTQRQRAYERRIKRHRRKMVGLDAIGDKEGFRKEAYALRQIQKEYEEFSKTAKLPMQTDRMQVEGFTSDINKRMWAVLNKGL